MMWLQASTWKRQIAELSEVLYESPPLMTTLFQTYEPSKYDRVYIFISPFFSSCFSLLLGNEIKVSLCLLNKCPTSASFLHFKSQCYIFMAVYLYTQI